MLAAVCAAAGFAGCLAKKTEKISVYMPDGAPAMALTALMREGEDGVEYRVVAPNLIASKVAAKDEEKNADICALPVTAASKLLGDGTLYQVLGTLTNGNLYVLTKREDIAAAFQTGAQGDLSFLLGETVGVMKINDAPGLTFQSVLNDYGVAWRILGNDGEVAADKVNLKGISDGTAIDPADTQIACYLVAEPAASVQTAKNGFLRACSLELLYHKGKIPKNGTGERFTGYPQAVLVAKKSLIDGRKAWINGFMDKVKASTEWLYTDEADGEKIVSTVRAHLEDEGYTSTLRKEVLTADCIRRAGACFYETAVCKTEITAYLQRIIAVQPTGAKEVSEEFFYQR